jgi:hypothetical protein
MPRAAVVVQKVCWRGGAGAMDEGVPQRGGGCEVSHCMEWCRQGGVLVWCRGDGGAATTQCWRGCSVTKQGPKGAVERVAGCACTPAAAHLARQRCIDLVGGLHHPLDVIQEADGGRQLHALLPLRGRGRSARGRPCCCRGGGQPSHLLVQVAGLRGQVATGLCQGLLQTIHLQGGRMQCCDKALG